MKVKVKELEVFLNNVKLKYDYDFENYNYPTLIRRIEVHCIKLNINSFNMYTRIVLSSEEIFEEMFFHFSINVTEFFREPKQVKIFTDEVIPYLKTFPHLKIWCAGCSIGMEAYSLSILLEENGLDKKFQIYATDFNNNVLEQAKNGLYDIPKFDEASQNYKASGGKYNLIDYFIKKGKFYQIKKRLKEKILFYNHNLVTDSIINNFQLIICKNVIIYFNEDLKDTILNKFYESLVSHGFIILGQNEFLSKKFSSIMKLYNKNSKVYQKKC